MRAAALLKLVLFVTTVWAGGYQGVLERVMLFYAYEIDGLNPESERTVGYACKGAFDAATKSCPGGWVKPKSKGDRANINELLAPLSKLRANPKIPFGRDSSGNPVPLADGTKGLDVEQTAKFLFPEILKATQGNKYPDGMIPNAPPYKMMKGGTNNFVEFLSDIGKMVQETSKRDGNYDKHRDLFEGFRTVNSQILDARIGDHGSFLIKGIQDKLQGSGITVKTKTVGGGSNPGSGETWETVDWTKTIDDGVADTGKSRKEVAKLVEAAAEDFYTNDKKAKEHKPVIDTTRRTGERMKYCG